MEEFKISLGVDINDASLNNIKSQINGLEAKVDPIKINIDLNHTKKQIDTIKSQIKNLNNLKGNNKTALSLDTATLEHSLNEVSTSIKEIRASLGTLDSKSGMKSLLSSVNQISRALSEVSTQFKTLDASLSSLAGKDFNLNVGINTGGSNPIGRNAAYGAKVRTDTLPQLKKQVEALEGYLKEYYKVIDGLNATQKLVQGTGVAKSGSTLLDLVPQMLNTSGSLSSQMSAYREYIALIKEAAKIKGVDLSHITSGFSKSADELVKDAQDIQTGAKETEQALKQVQSIFGGGNTLNVEGISSQLDSIVNDLNEIKVAIQGLSSGASIDGLSQNFKELSDTLKELMTNFTMVKTSLGNIDSVGSTIKNVEGSLERVNDIKFDSFNGQINELKSQLKDFGLNDASIDAITRDLEELGVAVQSVTVNLKNGALDGFTIKGTDGIERTVTATKKLDDELIKVTQSFGKLDNQSNKINFKIETGKFSSQIKDVENRFNSLSNKSDEVRVDIDKLKQELSNMETASSDGDIQGLINSYKEFEAVLEKVNNQLKINRINDSSDFNTEKLNQAKKSLSLEMDNWLKSNSAAAKQFGGTVRELQSQIKSCDNSGLKNLKSEFQNVKKEAQLAGKTAQTFGDQLKTQFSKYSSYFSVASAFMYIGQGLRDMFEQVKLIDSAMTELKKVTDETDATYNEFLTNAATRSREIGTTIDGLVSSTADFARLGYGFEDAQGLAEVANIYAVVGDEIEGVEGATESLISTMAAFKGEMNGMSNTDFAMSIIDKFNEIKFYLSPYTVMYM